MYKIKDLIENKIAVRATYKEYLKAYEKFNGRKTVTKEDVLREIGTNKKLQFRFYKNEFGYNDNNEYYKNDGYKVVDFSELDLDEIINDFQIY